METTVKCECGRDVPINPPQINADLMLICDHQAAEIERLQAERDGLAKMLADWCVHIKRNGTGWDDWDEGYKNASCRETCPPSLRKLIDEAMERVDAEWDLF